jgi:flagellin
MIEQSNMLQRMRELAVQAMNGTYSSTQRGYLDLEFQALSSQVDDISNDTMWNDQVLLNADSTNTSGVFTFQAGQASGQTISVTIGDMGASALGISGEAISTYDDAASALVAIGSALETINEQRATIGAGINRMEYAADNLTNVSSNATQSRSTIMDTDYALATTPAPRQHHAGTTRAPRGHYAGPTPAPCEPTSPRPVSTKGDLGEAGSPRVVASA